MAGIGFVDILIIILSVIVGIIVFGIIVACFCKRRKGQRGMIVEQHGNPGFIPTVTSAQSGPTAGYPPNTMLSFQHTQLTPNTVSTVNTSPPPAYSESQQTSSNAVNNNDEYTALDPSLRGRLAENAQRSSQTVVKSSSTRVQTNDGQHLQQVSQDTGGLPRGHHESQESLPVYLSFSGSHYDEPHFQSDSSYVEGRIPTSVNNQGSVNSPTTQARDSYEDTDGNSIRGYQNDNRQSDAYIHAVNDSNDGYLAPISHTDIASNSQTNVDTETDRNPYDYVS